MGFGRSEMEFMQEIGIRIQSFLHPSDDDILVIEASLSEYLQMSGFDADYKLTDKGKMCERILDKL